jgi:hypothetical protein
MGNARFRAAALAAVALAACSGSSSDTPQINPFQQQLQGYFEGCRAEGSNPDTRQAFLFSGNQGTVRSYSGYTSTDRTCAGDPVVHGNRYLTFTVGAAVTVPDPAGAGSVTAYELDVTYSDGTPFYTLGYIKPGTPDVFYGGGGSNDGSTRALRHTTLSTWGYLRRPTPAASSAWNGTWRACRNDGGRDFVDVFSFSNGGFEGRAYDYASSNGSCTGEYELSWAGTGTYADLGPQALTTVGVGGSIAVNDAHKLDVTFLATAAANNQTFYALGWMDGLSTPDAFYLGDDQSKTLGGSPALRTQVLQDIPRYLVPTPAPWTYSLAAMAGTWRECKNTGANDIGAEFVFTSGGAWSRANYTYTSNDSTCSTGATPSNAASGTYSFTAPTTALLLFGTGEMIDVPAYGASVDQTSPSAQAFTVNFYVDVLSGSPVLFADPTGQPLQGGHRKR